MRKSSLSFPSASLIIRSWPFSNSSLHVLDVPAAAASAMFGIGAVPEKKFQEDFWLSSSSSRRRRVVGMVGMVVAGDRKKRRWERGCVLLVRHAERRRPPIRWRNDIILMLLRIR